MAQPVPERRLSQDQLLVASPTAAAPAADADARTAKVAERTFEELTIRENTWPCCGCCLLHAKAGKTVRDYSCAASWSCIITVTGVALAILFETYNG